MAFDESFENVITISQVLLSEQSLLEQSKFLSHKEICCNKTVSQPSKEYIATEQAEIIKTSEFCFTHISCEIVRTS